MNQTEFWRDKCVIVTGASSGIGRAIAEFVAARQARVGLIARRRDLLEQLAANLTGQASAISFATADVTDEHAVRTAVQKLEDLLGPCDVMIASAGVFRETSGAAFDAAAANLVIATNVQGVTNAFAAVLPGMVDRRAGHLAAVASIAALLGLPGSSAYCASKAAVVRLLDSLRVDLEPLGIRVTTVSPGFVDTPMITDVERESRSDLLTAEATAARICRDIARGTAESWFPRLTWWQACLARWLPPPLYRRIMRSLEPMEEIEPGGQQERPRDSAVDESQQR